MELVLNTALKSVAVKGGAQVFSGRAIIPSLPATVAEILEGGFVQIVFEEEASLHAARVAEELAKNGYRVKSGKLSEEGETAEYTRLVVGVGGCAAAEAAKKKAAELGVECVLVIAYPDGNTFLQGGGVTQVYLDEDILDNCSDDRLAAGWGFAFSEPLKRFEDGFREKVMAERLPRRPALSLPPADAGALGLALCLLDCGAGMREDAYPCDIMARILSLIAEKRGKKPRLFGEYLFPAACALNVFYSSFLSSLAIDTLPPPDCDALLDEMKSLTGEARENLTHSFDFFDTNSYFRINYILGEYRLDLLERLNAVDMRSCERRWRRIYADAGYWLKRAFTVHDMLCAMKLAGATCKGLLHYVSATGFCERMLA